MGSDCTVSALENRFRRIKRDAKLINDAVSKGIDPLTLGIGSDEGTIMETSAFFSILLIAHHTSHSTAQSLFIAQFY